MQKGILSHSDLSAALGEAENRIEKSDDRKLSDANRAATIFPIRVLLLANQASQSGRKLSIFRVCGIGSEIDIDESGAGK
ncbi:hypothetical protein [Ensifer sp. ENS12]|uniref:hypothetical protein n=1 Tax=unclassified Ensifer TaxID=2633371 RepID=UPI002815A02A|nr:hypothetical protein [Ensifer sp. ENS12]